MHSTNRCSILLRQNPFEVLDVPKRNVISFTTCEEGEVHVLLASPDRGRVVTSGHYVDRAQTHFGEDNDEKLVKSDLFFYERHRTLWFMVSGVQ